MNTIRIMFAFTCIGICNSLNAVEPPRTTIRDALGQGKVAFLAHAEAIEIISANDHESIASMKLRVDRCYYGNSCNQGRFLTMTFVLQSYVDGLHPVFPVNFAVGRHILFVLHSEVPPGREYRFDSDLRSGTDLAFLGSTLPLIDDEDIEDHWESVYTHAVEKINLEQIESVAEHLRTPTKSR
jgi:hypothetical protein